MEAPCLASVPQLPYLITYRMAMPWPVPSPPSFLLSSRNCSIEPRSVWFGMSVVLRENADAHEHTQHGEHEHEHSQAG